MSRSSIGITDFLTQAGESVLRFNEFVENRGLNGDAVGAALFADHICYKCGSSESFEDIRREFERYATYTYQSVISKRRIAYIKLPGSMPSALGPICFLELSDQKPDGSQKEGFDHIEVCPTYFLTVPEAYDLMVTHLRKTDKVIEVVRPHHTTHDVDIGNGFIFRCSRSPLLEKIKATEMV